ncbi:MAG: sugar ABC transporter ATP-binding protein [Clostridia bacterium]|nr:sugar ABC transporter ATP-binding protein [Clostridia bacterium]
MNILEMKDIYKAFPGIVANDHVNLTLEKGEVLALIGENGAGKSTLMKILSGAQKPDSGTITVDGKSLSGYNTKEAIALGIGIVYQELNYLGALSIAENLYIGRVPTKGRAKKIDYARMAEDARAIMKEVGLEHLNPMTPVEQLSVAQKQLVEIARAFTRDLKILVLDEPTSALSDTETEDLFRLIRRFKANGVSIIYISHRLNEIFEVADSVMIMRDGKNVARRKISETCTEELVRDMVGREIKDMYPKRGNISIGKEIFRVENLKTDFLKDVSFDVREGEVVGLFGLMGAGRTEICDCIMAMKKYERADMVIDGKKYAPRKPSEALASGVAYVPAERKSDGICAVSSVKDNITIANLRKFAPKGIMNLKQEMEIAKGWVGKLNIKVPQILAPVDTLSGGNQQKVVVAKGLNTEPKLMILNEPTRGVDVGAKVEIYNLINDLCESRKAVLMISSELPEIMSMADRIFVIHEGRITGEILKDDFSQETLLKYAIGG